MSSRSSAPAPLPAGAQGIQRDTRTFSSPLPFHPQIVEEVGGAPEGYHTLTLAQQEHRARRVLRAFVDRLFGGRAR